MKRLFSLYSLLILLLLPMSIRSGAAEQVYHTVDLQTAAVQAYSLPAVTAVPEEGTFNYDAPGYGAQLEDPVAIVAYNTLLSSLSPETSKVHVDLSSFVLSSQEELTDAIEAALAAFVFDHPEFQYCHIISYGYGYVPNNDTLTRISVDYIIRQYSTSEFSSAAQKSALEEYTAAFRKNFDFTLPVVEQYRAIHDHICQLASYDYAAANCTSSFHDHTLAHSAYGLLVHELPVVCEGYARSFKILCDAVGLPCLLVNGEASEYTDSDGNPIFWGRSNHMWNAVCVDGSWYAVDVTWDDTDFHRGDLTPCPDLSLSFNSYDYFLNNTPFLKDSPTQDHRSTGEIYFLRDFPMLFALPELSSLPCPGTEDSSVRSMTLSCAGDTLEIPSILWMIQINGVALSGIPKVIVELPQDQVISSTFSVPTGKTYVLRSLSDRTDIPPTLSHADDFNAPLFHLQGNLILDGVSLTPAPGKPLATVSGGSLTGADTAQISCRLAADTPQDILFLQATYSETGTMQRISTLNAPAPDELFSYDTLFPAQSGAAVLTRSFLLNARTLAPAALDLLFQS